jgi:hypothetical protein
MSTDTYDQIIKEIEEIVDFVPFWFLDKYGKPKIQSDLFIDWLQSQGFYSVKIGDRIELVQIDKCVVKKITPSDTKQYTLKYVREIDDSERVVQMLIDNTRLWSLKYLDALKPRTIQHTKDLKDCSYFYFNNGIVEVNKNGIKDTVHYEDFKRLVWEDMILERDFKQNNSEPIFEDFIRKLCNNEEERILRTRCIIGYCLHTFKTSATSKALIIQDEEIKDTPEGGSGKSLFVDALSKLRNTTSIDGKRFEPTASFSYQNIDETINLFHIDDTRNGFQFEELFSVITNGFDINRKGKSEFHLPIEKSPLIIMTSNSVIRGIGGSFVRRQIMLYVNQYFSESHTPYDEYKMYFYNDWDSTEWNKFDTWMLNCMQLYLTTGIPPQDELRCKKTQAIKATSYSFVEWIEENKEILYLGISTHDAKTDYLNYSGNRHFSLSDKRFVQWVQDYCKINAIPFIKKETEFRKRGFIIGNDAAKFPF